MAKSSKTTTHKFPATAKALKQDLPAAKAAAEATKVAKKAQAKKMSALDAAAKVLAHLRRLWGFPVRLETWEDGARLHAVSELAA